MQGQKQTAGPPSGASAKRVRNAMRIRRLVVTVISMTGLLVGAMATAPPAMAQAPTQTAPACGPEQDIGKMCYFRRSNYQGSQAGFLLNEKDLLEPIRWVFGAGDGVGEDVANNAESGHNRDTACHVTIFFHKGWTGERLILLPGQSHPTLGVVHSENRSHKFHDCIF